MRPRLVFTNLLLAALFFALAPTAMASITWYVDGVNGSDNNDCKSPQTACKTIGHAISVASSGDSITVAPAIYTENLTIDFSLKILGAGPGATIIDGGAAGTVVTISNTGAHVTLSKLTIRNGIGRSTVGGGINNGGTLTINDSTISGNTDVGNKEHAGSGGGIFNGGTLTISNSTLSGNAAEPLGGRGGGISNVGRLTMSNSTLSGNTAQFGGGIYNYPGATVLQNSIVANSPYGGNCSGSGTMTSDGYNLSSDGSCNFNSTGDLNNTDPKLGPLQNNGGPTQTQALLPGSPAIDAGNPSGCTDGQGHLLKSDQRGYPRPDKEDTGGCDMGAYERQKD